MMNGSFSNETYSNSRFGCFMQPLRVKGPEKACKVITGGGVLSNIALTMRDYYDPLPPGCDEDDDDDNNVAPPDDDDAALTLGEARRQQIIRTYFS